VAKQSDSVSSMKRLLELMPAGLLAPRPRKERAVPLTFWHSRVRIAHRVGHARILGRYHPPRGASPQAYPQNVGGSFALRLAVGEPGPKGNYRSLSGEATGVDRCSIWVIASKRSRGCCQGRPQHCRQLSTSSCSTTARRRRINSGNTQLRAGSQKR